MLFPVFLDLSDKRVVIVGAGEVGRRKLASLAACAPRCLEVYDIREPDEELTRLLAETGARHQVLNAGDFPPVETADMVFVSTSCRKTNQEIARRCRESGVLCNVADAPEEGDVLVPAVSRVGRVSAAVATDGGSPALSRRIREEADSWLLQFAALAEVLARIRPHLLALDFPQAENARILRAIAWSSLGTQVCHGQWEEASSHLASVLPSALHPLIPEFLHGPV